MNRSHILFAVLISGCAAGSYSPSEGYTDEPISDLGGYEARLAELDNQLHATSVFGPDAQILDSDITASDCSVAADLRDRICDLSQRICDIAAREASAADVALKCQRARTTCDEAKAGVQRGCGGP